MSAEHTPLAVLALATERRKLESHEQSAPFALAHEASITFQSLARASASLTIPP